MLRSRKRRGKPRSRDRPGVKAGRKYNGRIRRMISRHKERLVLFIPLGIASLYVYSVFVNSVIAGIESTFSLTGARPEKVFDWNPFQTLPTLLSSTGLGITFVVVLLIMLINKKGYHFLSGYKAVRDKRGFDVLPDGTHGTSGFMKPNEINAILDLGGVRELPGTILGKLKDHPDDDDRYAEYVTPKANNGLNEHIMVFGASGAGKSRGFVKPFILQCARRKESLVLVDPKGEFYEGMSEFLRNQGYEVKAFNLLDMGNSDAWNCMADIETDKNLVQSMAEVIIRNTSNASERQDFWEKAEMNLFMALIHYTQGLCIPGTQTPLPIEQRSLGAIYKMLSGDSFTDIEERMNELPNSHPAKSPYGIFKLANRQIWGNIAIGLGNRLGVFQNELVDKITRHNEIDLELPGRKPCAYFCIISDQDSSLEFLSSLFFSTLFVRLTNYARRSGDERGRLPVKVNICLDEFCNIGKILDFKKIISTVRSRGINIQVIIQSAAQLSDRYEKKEWEEIIGNCDIQLFLGCNDQMTADYISKKCGMMTIGVQNNQMPLMPLFSPVLHSTRPYSQTKSSTQRALLMPDEVLRLPNAQSLVLLRGQKPLLLSKIIPDELPSFKGLIPVKIVDYVPEWRRAEEKAKAKIEKRVKSVSSKTKDNSKIKDTSKAKNTSAPVKPETLEKASPPEQKKYEAPLVFDQDEAVPPEIENNVSSQDVQGDSTLLFWDRDVPPNAKKTSNRAENEITDGTPLLDIDGDAPLTYSLDDVLLVEDDLMEGYFSEITPTAIVEE